MLLVPPRHHHILIEAWLNANPGKTLFIARLATNSSFILKRETDDFISVTWVLDGEVWQSERDPHIISYDECANFSSDMFHALQTH